MEGMRERKEIWKGSMEGRRDKKEDMERRDKRRVWGEEG